MTDSAEDDSGGAGGAFLRCSCSRFARVRFVPSDRRPASRRRCLISASGSLSMRHRAIADGSGSKLVEFMSAMRSKGLPTAMRESSADYSLAYFQFADSYTAD